ncbi:MAG: histidine--tRNA ligase [Dissulfuribacterales bacterium]
MLTAIRGFKDILPQDSLLWAEIEAFARLTFSSFGLREIRTPLIEKTEVFTRGIGEHTDIVEKEMYTFADRNGDSLSLRPEATAGILRAVLEHSLHKEMSQIRVFTIGPMFRHERPQKGRLRQFHQIDVEILGTAEPLADFEVIWLAWSIVSGFYERISQSSDRPNLRLEINSLGCPSCKPRHREDLLLFLENRQEQLCPDCQRRSQSNPLRVFDCKLEQCKNALKGAPLLRNYICPDCVEHLKVVQEALHAVNIPFVINPMLVRGLDYYNRTTFELISNELGAQGTVAAGGRYDGLAEQMEGPHLPGVGMAVGCERLILLAEQWAEQKSAYSTDIFVAAMGNEAVQTALPWIKELRKSGVSVLMPYESKGLKSLLKAADRHNAAYALILGESELQGRRAMLKDLRSHSQTEIAFETLLPDLLNTLKNSKKDAK